VDDFSGWDEEFGEFVRSAGECCPIVDVCFDEAVDPGIGECVFEVFGRDKGEGSLFGIVDGGVEHELVMIGGEVFGGVFPDGQGQACEVATAGVLGGVGRECGVASGVERDGEDDHRDVLGVAGDEGIDEAGGDAAGSAAVVEVFDEDVGGVAVSDEG